MNLLTICITGLSIDAMNGEYKGAVPLDHNPFQYGFYHVDSPLNLEMNGLLQRRHSCRYQLKI